MYNMHRSMASNHPHSNSHTLISDIRLRFSWVRVVFCFRDSARALAPSAPISFPAKCKNMHRSMASNHPHSNSHTLISDIRLRFSWVRVVFCFRDSARALAPSAPISFPAKCKNMHRSAASNRPHSNSHTLISDILSRFSWVRVVFCFRDSARALAPSAPISFPAKCKNMHRSAASNRPHSNSHTLISDIHSRFSWVTVVFCFRDSARALAPSAPISFPAKCKNMHRSAASNRPHSNSHTDFQHTFEIQLGKGRVLLQRLGQSAGTLSADFIPCKMQKYAQVSCIESPTFKQSHTDFRHTS